MKLIHSISYATLLLCYLIVFILLGWMIYPYKVVEYKSGPIPVINKHVKIGENVKLRNIFCKYMDVELSALPSIEDGIILNLMPFKSNTPKGCYNRIGYYKVPEILKPGDKARIHLTLNYKVNPIRTITYQLYSEEFTIVE